MWIVPWNLFLIKVLLKKEVCGSRKQCTERTGKAWNALLKKTKKKMWNAGCGCDRCIQMDTSAAFASKLVGPVHCSQDPQVLFLAKFSLKLGLTTLFIHLKIILPQCFQFSVISGIQTYSRCIYLLHHKFAVLTCLSTSSSSSMIHSSRFAFCLLPYPLRFIANFDLALRIQV